MIIISARANTSSALLTISAPTALERPTAAQAEAPRKKVTRVVDPDPGEVTKKGPGGRPRATEKLSMASDGNGWQVIESETGKQVAVNMPTVKAEAILLGEPVEGYE